MWLNSPAKKSIKIGARKSDLARLQAYLVGDALKAKGYPVEYLFRESLGDKNLENPLWKMPEKGVFTEDFFQDLVSGALDIVVHSWKDLPTEEKKETMIAATLPRADQRDLLVFKKKSLGRQNLQIFSSSPRREKNLKPFLAKVIPHAKSVQFQPVRGNVQTRVRKLLENPEVDGLIVAKAAMDRLLMATAAEFFETKNFLRQALDQDLQWMVLPLEINPNAPAQGALAIEVLREQTALIEVLKKIHCEKTYSSVIKERQIFSKFGGGCHQKIGVAILQRAFGEIEILCGESPSGEEFRHRRLHLSKQIPSGLSRKEVKFEIQRQKLKLSQKLTADAVLVSRFEAWPEVFSFSGLVWAAGLKTWQKLADLGVWVHGSSEGLGEGEEPDLEALMSRKLSWVRLTHADAVDAASVATYQVKLEPKPFTVASNDIFHWKSYSQFAACLSQHPELKMVAHACGPGRSFELIGKALGSDEKLFIEL